MAAGIKSGFQVFIMGRLEFDDKEVVIRTGIFPIAIRRTLAVPDLLIR